MPESQPGVLAPLPTAGRFLALGLAPGAPGRPLLDALAGLEVDEGLVVGVGAPLLEPGAPLGELRTFPALSGRGVTVPSTQAAVWAFLRGVDAGELLHRARGLVARLGPSVRVDEDVATFVYDGGRDLTGYEDGTENPKGARAAEVAIVAGRGPGLDGGTFVASQRWVHDLARLERLPRAAADAIIGRSRETNEELAAAPPSAHVKRAAQESFEPAAFMLRRSMPWGDVAAHGLLFVAFGASLDPFERVLRRMSGLDDGVVDGLFSFSRPVSGGYYFCPPVRAGRLDLRALR